MKLCNSLMMNILISAENSTTSLVEGLREEGFRFKECVLGKLMATAGEGRAVSVDIARTE